MAEVMNCVGFKCPLPVLRTAIKASTMAAGAILEVHADCQTFPTDIEKWCRESGKVLVSIVDHGTHRVATIQF